MEAAANNSIEPTDAERGRLKVGLAAIEAVGGGVLAAPHRRLISRPLARLSSITVRRDF